MTRLFALVILLTVLVAWGPTIATWVWGEAYQAITALHDPCLGNPTDGCLGWEVVHDLP